MTGSLTSNERPTSRTSVSTNKAVAVCTVSHNSAEVLPGFLAALAQLDPSPNELIVVDTDSEDNSCRLVEEANLAFSVRLVKLDVNSGFSGGMNRAIAETSADLILCLNPDTQPSSDFLLQLIACLDSESSKRVGAVTARLTRKSTSPEPTFDAAGMHLKASWRHLDRGSGVTDSGQYRQRQYVFGGTGAGTLFVRQALEDVSIDGQHFLEEFHTYREDAELAFRLQERDWHTVYYPSALCIHIRTNVPSRRSEMTQFVNYHSLKNRYLLRAYHENWVSLIITLVPSLVRDLGIVSWVLLRERSSLAAFSWLWRHRKFVLARRRSIQARRTASAHSTAMWFFRKSLPYD